MKKSVLRKILAVVLSAAMLCGTGFTTVGQFVGTDVSVNAVWVYGDFEYEFNDDDTITITKYTGNGGEITVPDTIDGDKVTGIKGYCDYYDEFEVFHGAFENCKSLKSIVIPDNVTYISEYAFDGCTGLTSIVIPDSVTEIGSSAFSDCTSLTIYRVKGSCAETYAKENNIPFVVKTLNRSTISAKEVLLGQTVTVNAKSSEDNCTYAVLYRKKSDTKWTVKQNYSTNDTITIKPAKATDYDVCVKVKNSNGKIVKKFFEVKVNAKLKNTSTISATEIKKGNSITLHGSATGGKGGYTYAALYKKKSETKWTVRQGYKDNSEIIVRPYTNTDYDICVKVKDNDGTIAKKYFTVTVTK